MRRSIYFAASCDIAADALGGYERIDVALETVYQALAVNPYGFPLIENDFTRARYVVTRPIRTVPALVWLFTIDENGNVTLDHVEEAELY